MIINPFHAVEYNYSSIKWETVLSPPPIPERRAAAAVLHAHVVVATETALVLHRLVPHAHPAGRASPGGLGVHAPRAAPHAHTVRPLAPHGGGAHGHAGVLGEAIHTGGASTYRPPANSCMESHINV
jgi:hypothetical protein